LPSSKQVSIGKRITQTRTNVASDVEAGALLKYVFNSPVLTWWRSTNQTSGPGKRSRTAITRTLAKRATKGPLPPSVIVRCLQRLAGSEAASWATSAD
jgi:hypothetical protein